MLPSDILTLALDHQWLALSAVVLGGVVRALKSDTRLPVQVPAEWRPWLAFGLGQIAALLQLVVGGATWRDALTTAIGAPLLAICGHWLGIEVLRGGKEVPLPGLTRAPDDGGES